MGREAVNAFEELGHSSYGKVSRHQADVGAGSTGTAPSAAAEGRVTFIRFTSLHKFWRSQRSPRPAETASHLVDSGDHGLLCNALDVLCGQVRLQRVQLQRGKRPLGPCNATVVGSSASGQQPHAGEQTRGPGSGAQARDCGPESTALHSQRSLGHLKGNHQHIQCVERPATAKASAASALSVSDEVNKPDVHRSVMYCQERAAHQRQAKRAMSGDDGFQNLQVTAKPHF